MARLVTKQVHFVCDGFGYAPYRCWSCRLPLPYVVDYAVRARIVCERCIADGIVKVANDWDWEETYDEFA